MNKHLLLATSDGLVVCERDGRDWRVATRGLEGRHVTSVIAREGVILAGTRDGVWRSDDLGTTWLKAAAGLTLGHVRWLAYHPDVSDREFAGTEPAGLFVSHDGGRAWRACAEVEALRDRHGWYLPYSPGAGCVRGFAFHGARAYAAVEVGGVLRSDDGGESWRLADGSTGKPDMSVPAGGVHPDVHSLAVHPSSADLVFAPTGGGFYVSADGGRTWDLRYACYCRAVWADPADAAHLVLGPADSVDRQGRIEETRDGGRTWRPALAGSNAPWPRHMVERFVPYEDELYAVLSNGDLLVSAIDEWAWRRVAADAGSVHAAAFGV